MELNSEGIPLILGKLIEYFVEKEGFVFEEDC